MSATGGSHLRSFLVTTGVRGRRLSISLATTVVAWSCMALVASSPADSYLSHDVLGRADVPMGVAVAGYSAGWLLMVAAMMLPVAVLVAGPVRRPGRWLIGYLGAWLAAGFVFAWFDLLLHAVVGASSARPETLLRICVVTGCACLSVVLASRETGWHVEVADQTAKAFPTGHGWLHGLRCVRTCGPMMLALQAGAPGEMSAMALAASVLALVRLRPRTWQFGPMRAARTGSRPNSFSPPQALTSAREGEADDERWGGLPVGPPGPVRGGGRAVHGPPASRALVAHRWRGSGRV